MRNLPTTLLAGAMTVGCIALAGGTASAVTPTTGLSAVQAKAAADITARQNALSGAIKKVQANAIITAADKSTLLTTLNADASGLTALGSKIAGDTTTAQAQADARTIFTTYRVYALAMPQVAYAAAADDITGAELPALVAAQQALSAALALQPSKNTGTVASAMADLARQIATVTATTTGLSATVLAFTPAQYNADHALLSGPRATLVAAQADVVTAKNDIVTVTGALQ